MLFATLALSACEPAARTGEQLANSLKDNIYNTAYAIDYWANTPPKGKGAPLPMKHSYCYKVQTDVLCYRQPMPGLETRLVGYQGAGAPPPPESVTRLLPKSAMNEDIKPENRIAKAKPVFEAPPKDEDPEKPNVEITPDATGSEVLPDPNSSPQL
ncbi:MAG: hypothetical protein EBV03_07220 [Proteobacteria bacterium]|nr:hypothetical protein [Pseudomonadota bacterium]